MSIIEKNISIKNYNTFAINAYADLFAAFNSIENLKELLQSHQLLVHVHALIWQRQALDAVPIYLLELLNQ